MDTATRPALRRSEVLSQAFPAPAETVRTVTATATYWLSENGRKASLVAGGDGRAVQRIQIQVPAARLHLVSVNAKGFARLKLSPRFELNTEQRVVRIDAPPRYDVLPSVDDLFREAARNHELERAYHAERTAADAKRRQAEEDWRLEVAQTFLSDSTQRALLNPYPSRSCCYIATDHGRVRFDVVYDDGLARDVPPEAFRRFQTDLRVTRERRNTERAEDLRLHEDKKRTAAEWILQHGSCEQQSRQAAGLLPIAEAIEAMQEQAFRALADRPRYTRRGVSDLNEFLTRDPRFSEVVLNRADVMISVHKAATATAAQWAFVQELQAAVPDAVATLLVHEMMLKVDARAPRLRHFTVLLTKKIGSIVLRGEFRAQDK